MSKGHSYYIPFKTDDGSSLVKVQFQSAFTMLQSGCDCISLRFVDVFPLHKKAPAFRLIFRQKVIFLLLDLFQAFLKIRKLL